jgi:hypothetical protein
MAAISSGDSLCYICKIRSAVTHCKYCQQGLVCDESSCQIFYTLMHVFECSLYDPSPVSGKRSIDELSAEEDAEYSLQAPPYTRPSTNELARFKTASRDGIYTYPEMRSLLMLIAKTISVEGVENVSAYNKGIDINLGILIKELNLWHGYENAEERLHILMQQGNRLARTVWLSILSSSLYLSLSQHFKDPVSLLEYVPNVKHVFLDLNMCVPNLKVREDRLLYAKYLRMVIEMLPSLTNLYVNSTPLINIAKEGGSSVALTAEEDDVSQRRSLRYVEFRTVRRISRTFCPVIPKSVKQVVFQFADNHFKIPPCYLERFNGTEVAMDIKNLVAYDGDSTQYRLSVLERTKYINYAFEPGSNSANFGLQVLDLCRNLHTAEFFFGDLPLSTFLTIRFLTCPSVRKLTLVFESRILDEQVFVNIPRMFPNLQALTIRANQRVEVPYWKLFSLPGYALPNLEFLELQVNMEDPVHAMEFFDNANRNCRASVKTLYTNYGITFMLWKADMFRSVNTYWSMSPTTNYYGGATPASITSLRLRGWCMEEMLPIGNHVKTLVAPVLLPLGPTHGRSVEHLTLKLAPNGQNYRIELNDVFASFPNLVSLLIERAPFRSGDGTLDLNIVTDNVYVRDILYGKKLPGKKSYGDDEPSIPTAPPSLRFIVVNIGLGSEDSPGAAAPDVNVPHSSAKVAVSGYMNKNKIELVVVTNAVPGSFRRYVNAIQEPFPRAQVSCRPEAIEDLMMTHTLH